MVFQCLLFIDSIEKRGASEKTKKPAPEGTGSSYENSRGTTLIVRPFMRPSHSEALISAPTRPALLRGIPRVTLGNSFGLNAPERVLTSPTVGFPPSPTLYRWRLLVLLPIIAFVNIFTGTIPEKFSTQDLTVSNKSDPAGYLNFSLYNCSPSTTSTPSCASWNRFFSNTLNRCQIVGCNAPSDGRNWRLFPAPCYKSSQ